MAQRATGGEAMTDQETARQLVGAAGRDEPLMIYQEEVLIEGIAAALAAARAEGAREERVVLLALVDAIVPETSAECAMLSALAVDIKNRARAAGEVTP